MKKFSKNMSMLGIVAVLLMAVGTAGCGAKKGGKVKISEKANLLMAHNWKLDPNATIKETTDNIKDTTGITADITLGGDVETFANFVAETLIFGEDKKDKTKLSYSRTIGEGLLSSSVLGYWSLSDDESSVVMREWDSQKGEEKAPVNYKIVELTDTKLVLLKEGDSSPNVYNVK